MIGMTLFAHLSFIAFFVIFTAVMVQTAHRCFSLINEIPDKIIMIVNGGNENLGEASSEQQGVEPLARAWQQLEVATERCA